MNKRNIKETKKGWKLAKLKQYDKALITFEKVLKINNKNFDAWRGKGQTLAILKRYDEALVAFEKALTISPEDIISLSSKGILLFILKQYDKALAIFEKVLNIDSTVVFNGKIVKAYYFSLKEKSKEDESNFNKLFKTHKQNLKKEVISQILKTKERYESYEKLIPQDFPLAREPYEKTDNKNIIGFKTNSVLTEVIVNYPKDSPDSLQPEFAKLAQSFFKSLELPYSIKFQPIVTPSVQNPSSKNPIAKFPTPTGTKWDNITIVFINGETVKIIIKGSNIKYPFYTFSDMGFKDGKTGDPNLQWQDLYKIAENYGILDNNTTVKTLKWDALRRRKKDIADTLKAFFSLTDDPFCNYKIDNKAGLENAKKKKREHFQKWCWRTRFTILLKEEKKIENPNFSITDEDNPKIDDSNI